MSIATAASLPTGAWIESNGEVQSITLTNVTVTMESGYLAVELYGRIDSTTRPLPGLGCIGGAHDFQHHVTYIDGVAVFNCSKCEQRITVAGMAAAASMSMRLSTVAQDAMTRTDTDQALADVRFAIAEGEKAVNDIQASVDVLKLVQGKLDG